MIADVHIDSFKRRSDFALGMWLLDELSSFVQFSIETSGKVQDRFADVIGPSSSEIS
jgi:hypothetical protein